MPLADPILIQVVPRLQPGRCGISDHALALADELETGFGVTSAFAVLNSQEACDLRFPITYCQTSQLWEACKNLSDGTQAALLVHYSGYGYSADGAPLALADALKRVHESQQIRVGVYFHELFASSMPWRSGFWYRSRQQHVVRSIVKACDFMATNLERHCNWIERKAAGEMNTPLLHLPVFSNVGEALERRAMNGRRPALIVFGLAGTRQKSYAKIASLGSMLRVLRVREILDIGPESAAPPKLNGLPVRHMGVLSTTDLSGVLSESMFGFVPHPWFCLAKSGIFAGICAHGTIPVLGESFSAESDGLKDGVHLFSPKTTRGATVADLEQLSAAGWHWYMGHRLQAHAETYARLLVQAPAEGTALPAAGSRSDR